MWKEKTSRRAKPRKSAKGNNETQRGVQHEEILVDVEAMQRNHLTCLNFLHPLGTCNFLGLWTSWKPTIFFACKVLIIVEFPSYKVFLQCVM
jgi:hypothetical protein